MHPDEPGADRILYAGLVPAPGQVVVKPTAAEVFDLHGRHFLPTLVHMHATLSPPWVATVYDFGSAAFPPPIVRALMDPSERLLVLQAVRLSLFRAPSPEARAVSGRLDTSHAVVAATISRGLTQSAQFATDEQATRLIQLFARDPEWFRLPTDL
jgi:hypothetical protein